MQLRSYQSWSASQSSRQTMLCLPMWLILSHSELPGDEEDSYSFLLQPIPRYLGFTARRYSGSVSMVVSCSTRLSGAVTPSRTSSFVQRTILIFCNLERPLILFSSGQSNTSRSTTEGKFSTCVRLESLYRASTLGACLLLLARPGGRQLNLQLSIWRLSRQGMAMAVSTSICSSQSFHSHSSHSHSPTNCRFLSFGNGADVLASEPLAATEDDAWNFGPIRLMAGASLMVSNSKLGRQRRPSGSCVQQGRFCSLKYLRLLKSADAGAHIQFGSWRPTYPSQTKIL